MFRYSGGDKVKKGYYWNFSTGERMHFSDEAILPGDSKEIYLHAGPGFLLLLIAPFLGLSYAFFLPVAGIAMLALAAVKKVKDMLWSGLEHISHREAVKRPELERVPNSEKNS